MIKKFAKLSVLTLLNKNMDLPKAYQPKEIENQIYQT